jgi:Zn ribbon nucleic-acid-binding protein
VRGVRSLPWVRHQGGAVVTKKKPCPWCNLDDALEDIRVSHLFCVECARCGAQGPHGNDPEHAIKWWNWRAKVVTADQLAELRALHKSLPPARWSVEAGVSGECTIEQISAVQLVAQLRNLLAEIDEQTEGAQ